MIPGEYLLRKEKISCNEGKEITVCMVVNQGDRPIQVGSHFHFYEVNEALVLERTQAYGTRLNIPAGTSVRFEPGDPKEVQLIPFGGERKVYGFNNKVDGGL
ncbi:urease subunit beta [Bacillus sp. CECT 9360]|uniref:urease subunit beta n=1 Tax=Bacillus sp. CECT 9360 TaxID=2845821 RepID=UPI001E5F7574|nr:urease subunit beta [Bacillus sp. CECT 9360]CAH0346520.1 Urease subunit beta [Bacillus sp. CECT 9360]